MRAKFRLGADVVVFSPFLSRPRELADVLARIADDAQNNATSDLDEREIW